MICPICGTPLPPAQPMCLYCGCDRDEMREHVEDTLCREDPYRPPDVISDTYAEDIPEKYPPKRKEKNRSRRCT